MSAQHRKQSRLAQARARTAARHRRSSPLATALAGKPARFAAAMAGSVLVASVGSPAAHWAGSAAGLLTSVHGEAMSTLGTAPASPAGALAPFLPVTGHRSAPLPQSGLAGQPRQTVRSAAATSAPRHARAVSAAQAAYRNPLRAASGLLAERVDEGVDFGGSGPVYALGDAVVTNATGSNYGWPGGGWITYRLTSGPAAGQVVFLAEDVTPSVSVGQHITSATVIATMFEGGDGIETGWAMPDGSTAESQSPAAGAIGGSGPYPTVIGMNFEALLESLGVPAGNNAGVAPSGLLPSGYPASWR